MNKWILSSLVFLGVLCLLAFSTFRASLNEKKEELGIIDNGRAVIVDGSAIPEILEGEIPFEPEVNIIVDASAENPLTPPKPIVVDYEPVLDERQAKVPYKMDWRKSIVDLLKLIFKPSSREDRRQMAEEMGYDGPNSTFSRNIWLHRQVRKGLRSGEIPLGEEK